MTTAQQLASLGISAEAYEGFVIIEMDRSFMTFTPEEVIRFDGFLHRACKDAIHRDRAGAGAGAASDRVG